MNARTLKESAAVEGTKIKSIYSASIFILLLFFVGIFVVFIQFLSATFTSLISRCRLFMICQM